MPGHLRDMAGQQRRHAQGLTATPGRHFHGLRRSVWCAILRLSCAQRSVTEALQSGDTRVAERPSPAGNLAGTLTRYVEFCAGRAAFPALRRPRQEFASDRPDMRLRAGQQRPRDHPPAAALKQKRDGPGSRS